MQTMKKDEQLLEDLHDLTVVAERRNEKTVNLADMKKRLALCSGGFQTHKKGRIA